MENSQSQHTSFDRPQAQAVRCANCDIDILWPPTVVPGKTYCCTGCAEGGPCNCDYSQYRSVTISGVIHYGPHVGLPPLGETSGPHSPPDCVHKGPPRHSSPPSPLREPDFPRKGGEASC